MVSQYTLFLSNPFTSNAGLKLAKNQANAKQHPEAELCYLLSSSTLSANSNKQILHNFLFNIRNYSPEIINIQRREAELDIILPRVNNFDVK